MSNGDKIDILVEELKCAPMEAKDALNKRLGRIDFAREFILHNQKIKRAIKSGEALPVLPDSELYPLWGEFLKKQNG